MAVAKSRSRSAGLAIAAIDIAAKSARAKRAGSPSAAPGGGIDTAPRAEQTIGTPSGADDFGVAWGIRVLFMQFHRHRPMCLMPQRHLRIRLRSFDDQTWIPISGPVSGPERLFQGERFHAWLDGLVPAPERPVHVVLSADDTLWMAAWSEAFRILPYDLIRLRVRSARPGSIDQPGLFDTQS